MASHDLTAIHSKILQSYKAKSHKTTASLLPQAKQQLVLSNSLLPSPSTPQKQLILARDILEIGALTSIHLIDKVAFRRYHSQLQPFYDLSPSLQPESQNQGKIIGLYLLLLLSENQTAEFYTVLEMLEGEGRGQGEDGWGWGEYVKYPVMLERWLMEGSYDKIWEATRGKTVPSEEFSTFSKVMVETIRMEIAHCSEKAYASLPISNAKNLLFLDSDRSVTEFAKKRDWRVRDGRIYFPEQEDSANSAFVASDSIIENTISYANELETIV